MQAKPYIREYKIEEMVDPGIKGQILFRGHVESA